MNDYETKSIPQELASGNYVKVRNPVTQEVSLVLSAYFENFKKTNGADDSWLMK